MKQWLVLLSLFVLMVGGCARPDAPAPAGQQAAGESHPDLLKPLLLAQPPAKVQTIAEARQKGDGEEVIVRGKVPPATVRPFNAALATFQLMAPEDLAKPEIQEELSCDDAPT